MMYNQKNIVDEMGIFGSKNSLKRIWIMLLFLLFYNCLQFVFVMEASAASGNTEEMYVISEIKTNIGVDRISYNENGLIESMGENDKFYYDDAGRVTKNMHGTSEYSYKYNEKGQLTNINDFEIEYDEKGHVKSFSAGVVLYEYDKDNFIVRAVEFGEADLRYAYDSYGNRIWRTFNGTQDYKWKNRYENGRVKSVVEQYTDRFTGEKRSPEKFVFKYDKITVPSENADKVQAQQWYLVNRIGIGIEIYDGPNVGTKRNNISNEANDNKDDIEKRYEDIEFEVEDDDGDVIENVPVPDQNKELTGVPKISMVKWKANNQCTLSWNGVDGAEGYIVEYSTDGIFSEDVSRSVESVSTEVTLNDIPKNTDYYIRVRAYATGNGMRVFSEWSHRIVVNRKH